MLITKQKIIMDTNSEMQISVLSIFAIVGLFIPFIPFVTLQTINTNTIISFAFLTVIFGIPFGYFIGIRKITQIIRIKRKLKNGDFSIWLDTITDMSTVLHGKANEMSDSFCQLTLEQYSNETSQNVRIKKKEFLHLHEGDKCILIFVTHVKKPILIYPGNEYEVDMDLKCKIQ